jgi:hypothetical protein
MFILTKFILFMVSSLNMVGFAIIVLTIFYFIHKYFIHVYFNHNSFLHIWFCHKILFH